MIEVNKHVTWTKLEGKPNASMVEKRGFGYLYYLPEPGKGIMRIDGDYGVYTSTVESVEQDSEGNYTVRTKNSLYKVSPRK